MQTTFQNSMVAHVWAQQSQPHGTNPGRTFYFEDESIYSYGDHYLLARFITPLFVLINSEYYSSTTARHASYVRNALDSAVRVIEVPCNHIEPDTKGAKGRNRSAHECNIEYLVDRAIELTGRAQRSRSSHTANWAVSNFEATLENIAFYAEHFRVRSNAAVKKAMTKLNRHIVETKFDVEAVKAKAAEREAVNTAAKIERDALKIPRWKAGELRSLPHDVEGTYLRLNRSFSGEPVVQTSRGAEVPLQQARVLYKAWVSGRPIHGVNIGHFTVTSATEEEVHIGCHVLKADVLHEFFKGIGE